MLFNVIEKFETLSSKITTLLGERAHFGVPVSKSNQVQHLFDYESLSQILHYEVFDAESDLFYNKDSIGFVLEAQTLLGASEQSSKVIARIITNMLPESADLQFLLWGSDKVGPILDRYVDSRKDHPVFSALASERVNYLKKGAYESLIKDGANLIRDFKLLLCVSLPGKNENNAKALISLRENMMSALASIHMSTQKMAIGRFINFVSDILHPKENVYPSQKKIRPYDSLAIQLIDTDRSMTTYPDYLLFEAEGENDPILATTYNVSEYPTRAYLSKMDEAIGKLYDKINQIPCPFLISFHVRLSKKGNSKFLTIVKSVDAEKTANSKQRSLIANLGAKADEQKMVQKRLDEGDKLVETYFQITLFSKAHAIVKAENALISLYESNGWKLKKITKLQLQSFLVALPMRMSEMVYDLKTFGRFYTMSAFNAANLAPVLAEWHGTRTPHLLLNGRRGQLCTFSPFDNEKGNFNTAIAAKSGSGKSVLAQEYVAGMHGSGGKVWVIDIGRSFQSTCELVGGSFIDFNPDYPFCINPFTHIKNFKDTLELHKSLLGTMARPSSKVSDEELVYLEQALTAAWEQSGNKATIKTVATWLENQDSSICKTLAHLLYSYTTGSFAPYFEGDATIDLTASFVVVELERFVTMPQLLRIILMVLTFQITEGMTFGNKFQTKTLIIDEYWRYSKDLSDLASAIMGEFIGELARTVRKQNGSLVTIVQSIEDYFTNPSAISVYNNSDYLLVMSQKSETLAKLSANHQLSMNPLSEKLYQSIEKTNEYSELIIKGPSGLSIHRLILDPFSRILFSSKAEEFELVKHYKNNGHTLVEAIKRVAAEVIYD